METLEKSRMCRLCGKNSGISIDIFDKNENHVRKINAVLPILVHEMDLLPKQMCHRCSYKLEEFYNFYVECAKTDTELKSQLSWMSKDNLEEKIITPMVKMNPFKIKTEPTDPDGLVDSNGALGSIEEDSLLFPTSILHKYDNVSTPILSCSRCRCLCYNRINIDKESLKKIKSSPKSENGSQPQNSKVHNKGPSNEMQSSKKVASKHFDFDKDIIKTKHLQKQKDTLILKDDKNYSKSDKLNRALRPRKCSVDYVGPKKKGVATNLKEKLKSKLDMINPTLVNPFNLSQVSQNSAINSGMIVKLEKVDDSLKVLRTQKNLEEFNKRIKELQRKHNKHRKQNSNRQFSFGEENEKKFLDKERLKNLQREKVNRNKSADDENCKLRKNLPINHTKNFEDAEENKTSKSINADLDSKQEEKLKNRFNEPSENQIMQGKHYNPDTSKGSKDLLKHLDKLPLCAVVKLEKDYTCNVDYPRLKIKRHLAIASTSKLEDDSVLQDVKKESPIKLLEKISVKEKIPSKTLRSKESKSNSKGKAIKIKKKRKSEPINSIPEKIPNTLALTEVKRYCEQCEMSFMNMELYKLHPCYQN